MAVDLFDFWSGVPGDAHWHPEDERVLARVPHRFKTECLPNPFFGPLRTAPVVFLFLSPGFRPEDLEHARCEKGQDYYKRQRTGDAPLPGKADYEPTWRWWKRKIGKLGIDLEEARCHVAFLNINAYKSKSFTGYHMLARLPSCRGEF